MSIKCVAQTQLPTKFGLFQLHGFLEISSQKEHLALTFGDISQANPVLMRIHSECLTGDALFSQRCDCGAQLEQSLQRIAQEGSGVLLYLRQEGRGIGLMNKIKAYALQDQGMDTVQANESLGFKADQRDFSICQPMLKHLGIAKVKLLTNNPRKVEALRQADIEVVERVALEIPSNPHNQLYLRTKKSKLGHWLGQAHQDES